MIDSSVKTSPRKKRGRPNASPISIRLDITNIVDGTREISRVSGNDKIGLKLQELFGKMISPNSAVYVEQRMHDKSTRRIPIGHCVHVGSEFRAYQDSYFPAGAIVTLLIIPGSFINRFSTWMDIQYAPIIELFGLRKLADMALKNEEIFDEVTKQVINVENAGTVFFINPKGDARYMSGETWDRWSKNAKPGDVDMCNLKIDETYMNRIKFLRDLNIRGSVQLLDAREMTTNEVVEQEQRRAKVAAMKNEMVSSLVARDKWDDICTNAKDFAQTTDLIIKKDGAMCNLFHTAVMLDKREVVQALLAVDYPTDIRTSEGTDALGLAMLKNLPEMMEILIMGGANVNCVVKNLPAVLNENALTQGVADKKKPGVSEEYRVPLAMLLKHKVDISVNHNDLTPLTTAITGLKSSQNGKYFRTIQLLINAGGMEIFVPNVETPIELCIKYSNEWLLGKMIPHINPNELYPMAVNHYTFGRMTAMVPPLFMAMYYEPRPGMETSHFKIMDELLYAGASRDAKVIIQTPVGVRSVHLFPALAECAVQTTDNRLSIIHAIKRGIPFDESNGRNERTLAIANRRGMIFAGTIHDSIQLKERHLLIVEPIESSESPGQPTRKYANLPGWFIYGNPGQNAENVDHGAKKIKLN